MINLKWSVTFSFPEDFDVQNENASLVILSVHCFEKIWILVNFIQRRQFRHLALVTSTGKQKHAALTFYTAGHFIFTKARNPGEHSIVAVVLVHFWSDPALGAKICWCSHFLFLQKALKFHDENLQFAQKYVFRLFCEDPDFIKDILKETWCSPDLQKILSRQWSANDKKWKWEQKREKILKVSSKNWRRKKESDISKYDIFSQWSEFNLTWLKMVVLSKWQIWPRRP